MGKWKGITASELNTLRKIERINYQLRAIANEFGTNSRLYKHYENFLTSTRKNSLADAGLIRETKSGAVLQLRADKKAVREFAEYTAYQKALNRVAKFQTVGQRKAQMLETFGKRKGVDISRMRQAERRKALQEEKEYERYVYEVFNDVLYKYYELEKKVGFEFESNAELRKLSEGSRTTPENMKKMLDIMQAELDSETHKVKTDYDDYLKGL